MSLHFVWLLKIDHPCLCNYPLYYSSLIHLFMLSTIVLQNFRQGYGKSIVKYSHIHHLHLFFLTAVCTLHLLQIGSAPQAACSGDLEVKVMEIP